MPKIYATTKKGKLEAMLKQSGKAFTKQEMIRAMADQGVIISRSSVNSAVEEWEMNNWLIKDAAGKYAWKKLPMTNSQARYRFRHPDRAAATLASVEARTVKRASVRFMEGRDDALYQWLEETYGAVGGPEILRALNDLKNAH